MTGPALIVAAELEAHCARIGVARSLASTTRQRNIYEARSRINADFHRFTERAGQPHQRRWASGTGTDDIPRACLP